VGCAGAGNPAHLRPPGYGGHCIYTLAAEHAYFLPLLWAENKKRKVGFRWKWKDIKDFIIPGVVGVFLMQYLYTLGS